MRSAVLRKEPSPMPAPVDSIVEVRGVCKTYADVEALRGIDLDFPRGKLTSLLGPSGCGKTTLLKIIAGLIEANAGTVTVDGKLVNGPGPERAFYTLFTSAPQARNKLAVMDGEAASQTINQEEEAAP